MPGLGHAYVGRLRRGVGWWAAGVAAMVICLAVLAYFPVPRVNALVGFGILAVWFLGAAVDAVTLAWRSPPQAPRRRYQRWWAYILLFVAGAAANNVLAAVERRVWMEAYASPAAGMAPTILAGDRILVDRLPFYFREPQQGDVIAFHTEGTIFVQRVIGVAGDVVELRQDQLFLNGQSVAEGYAYVLSNAPAPPESRNMPPLTVPAGELFLMGDNRLRSSDSRLRGTTPVADVIGLARCVYWSRVPPVPRSPLGQALPEELGIADGEEPGSYRWSRFGALIR